MQFTPVSMTQKNIFFLSDNPKDLNFQVKPSMALATICLVGRQTFEEDN